MLNSVSTLLRLMVYRSVVYRNGRNWTDEYSVSGRIQKCGEGGKERGFLKSRSRGSREKGVGAGAREKKESEPGPPRTRRMDSEPGPERRGMQQYISMKRRRD